jgi:hypothetical protein
MTRLTQAEISNYTSVSSSHSTSRTLSHPNTKRLWHSVHGSASDIVYYSNGSTWSWIYTALNQLEDVWVCGPTDVWAVGTQGTVLHYDGTNWTQQTLPGNLAGDHMWAVYGWPSYEGSTEYVIYVVGSNGTVICHYPSESYWKHYHQNQTLFDVWGVGSPKHFFYTVGGGGIHQWDTEKLQWEVCDVDWKGFNPVIPNHLHVTSAGNVFAACYSGVVLRATDYRLVDEYTAVRRAQHHPWKNAWKISPRVISDSWTVDWLFQVFISIRSRAVACPTLPIRTAMSTVRSSPTTKRLGNQLIEPGQEANRHDGTVQSLFSSIIDIFFG